MSFAMSFTKAFAMVAALRKDSWLPEITPEIVQAFTKENPKNEVAAHRIYEQLGLYPSWVKPERLTVTSGAIRVLALLEDGWSIIIADMDPDFDSSRTWDWYFEDSEESLEESDTKFLFYLPLPEPDSVEIEEVHDPLTWKTYNLIWVTHPRLASGESHYPLEDTPFATIRARDLDHCGELACELYPDMIFDYHEVAE